ncbi:MAG: phage terminase small subunit P27 family [Gemmatimonadetes bacterium]|nr:phage terminase small subunit P27 family [Gemmatimonadota bacterium]|tara:strand:- start:319 stop:768 length:450 start_codon:yes stop_codon:yes gene_type:complete
MSRPKPTDLRTGHSTTLPEFRPNPTAVETPQAPQTLKSHGKHLWAELWDAGRNFYQPKTDSLVLERYCNLQERRKELLEIIEAEGWLAVGSTGQTVTHPAAKLLAEVEGRLSPLEDRLGLNPESRLRLGISSVEHQSKLDAFLSKVGGA